MPSAARTLFDKLWDSHVIVAGEDGTALLWVDRHYVHEGSHHAFAKLRARGARVAEPALTIAICDHYAPTRGRELPIADPDIARMTAGLETNARDFNLCLFGLTDPRQGIVHVVGPEQGLSLPGMLVVCGDSHTSTHGALGAFSFGIGATDVAHVLATQTIRQKKPLRMRIAFEGELPPGVGAKDMALHWISALGADAAQGCAVEYSGEAVSALSVEERLTLCNMSIEGGARCGLVAPDGKTLAWLRERPYAPADWDAAVAQWSELVTDAEATFDREARFDVSEIAPIVTWGTTPDEALPITSRVPEPARESDPARAARISEVLAYMGLAPGQPLEEIEIDQGFIGSCTNGRIEDLRAAAAVLKGRRARVPGLVSSGSRQVKLQAEQEGLDQVFRNAGLEWADSGCSLCVSMNGDRVAPGQRCASSTNRNFKGRQGAGARTHLMSPAMVAAACVTGRLTDVRRLTAVEAA